MARQPALNIADYTDQSTMDNLAEVLDGVIENIQVSAVSEALKNTNGSGNPEGGSVEYKRFVNAELKAKGTARTAGAGEKVIANPIIVNLDDDKEIVEELQRKDIELYGIDGMSWVGSTSIRKVFIIPTQKSKRRKIEYGWNNLEYCYTGGCCYFPIGDCFYVIR